MKIVTVEMPIEIRPSRSVDGVWVASCPLLGLLSQGASEGEATEEIRYVITSWSRAMYARGLTCVPEAAGKGEAAYLRRQIERESGVDEAERVDRTLDDLLAHARAVEMTDAEKEAQRRSFAFGNASIDNPNVTRAMVDEAAERTPRRD